MESTPARNRDAPEWHSGEEPQPPHLNQCTRRGDQSLRATTGDRAGGEVARLVRLGAFMRIQRALWLDCDLGSLTVLVIGVCAVSLLAFGGF